MEYLPSGRTLMINDRRKGYLKYKELVLRLEKLKAGNQRITKCKVLTNDMIREKPAGRREREKKKKKHSIMTSAPFNVMVLVIFGTAENAMD